MVAPRLNRESSLGLSRILTAIYWVLSKRRKECLILMVLWLLWSMATVDIDREVVSTTIPVQVPVQHQAQQPQQQQLKPSVSKFSATDFNKTTIPTRSSNQRKHYLRQQEAAALQTESTTVIDVVQWRNRTQTKCQQTLKKIGKRRDEWAMKEKNEVDSFVVSQLQFPDPRTISDERPANHQPYDICKNTFVDLGTNIGDSIGYFMDSAIDVCTPMWREINPNIDYWSNSFSRPRINVTSLEFHTSEQYMNMLLLFLHQTMMKEWNVLPESFCVYGMEGNPLFTKQLIKLENFLMALKPRFFQHLHIHTETVITKVNGPTKLFLDQVSTEKNFWGSSILDSLTDAKKTAEQKNNGTAVYATVTGLNLSTLLQRTLAPFRLDAREEDKTGGKLLIKMDVEGAEYQVVKEIAKTGLLCEYIARGNEVIMLVEFHTHRVIENKTDFKRQKAGHKKAKQTLEDCGVKFEDLAAGWV